ncbi:outer membrane beta-barrel protein [Aliikangiella sp. IMCC44359]|uniref:outer membrane beta-barrel protein n=1 Tax=Aliikangiella sp. IMCC44359 TaxID=3459125 RepID=UPI00403AA6E1
MKISPIFHLFILLFTLTLNSLALHAESLKPTQSIKNQLTNIETAQDFLGYYMTLGVEQISLSVSNTTKLDPVSESFVGIGYQISNHWSTELNYLTSQVTSETSNLGHITYLDLSTLYQFTPYKSSWYSKLGVGYYQFNKNIPFKNKDFTVNLGAGYRHYINANLFVVLDLQAIYPFNRKATDWNPSLSLNYLFAAKK